MTRDRILKAQRVIRLKQSDQPLELKNDFEQVPKLETVSMNFLPFACCPGSGWLFANACGGAIAESLQRSHGPTAGQMWNQALGLDGTFSSVVPRSDHGSNLWESM